MSRGLTSLDMAWQNTPATPGTGYVTVWFGTAENMRLLRDSGGSSPVWPGFDGPKLVQKPTTTSTTSTGLADLPGLSFSVIASKEYVFEFWGTYTSTTTTTAPYFAVNGPTLGTNGLLVMGTSPPSDTGKRFDAATAYDTPMGPGGVVTIGQVNNWAVWGYVQTGASAGTLSMRYRTDVSGESISVQAGAFGRLWGIG
jgi:hypothetical protein